MMNRSRLTLSFAPALALMMVCALGAPMAIQAAEKAKARPAFTPLFEAETGGYLMYRIPGLVVTGKGTILAYCEARRQGGDWAPIDVLLRRSTDGGRSWSAPQKMAEAPADLKLNAAAEKKGIKRAPGAFTANNPVAIADAAPGVVHFIYHLEYARVFYRRSEDDGATWSAPREITAAVEGFRDRYPWVVVGNGCGHGLQLKAGPHKGRLVVAVWLSLGTGGGAHRPSDLATIYSDDGGATWKCGEFIARDGDEALPEGKIVNPSETALAELPGGKVLANIRSESAANRRLLSVSADGATGWSKPEFKMELAEPVCMGSMAGLGDGKILFSNPDNLLVKGKPGEPGKNRDRRNVTIKMTGDGGRTWPVARVLEPGPSGYSDLAAGPDGTIYCLFEKGAEKGKVSPAALVLARLDLKGLTGK